MLTPTRVRESMAGAIILTFFGALWLILALANWHTTPAWPLPLALLASVALLGMCVLRIKSAGIDSDPPDAAALARRKQIRKPYWSIVGVEFAACGLSSNLLARHQLNIWIPFAIALIVGIHFLPLASLFEAPIYYLTGSTCVLGVLACLFIQNIVTRMVVVGLVMAFVLWATVVTKLVETRQQSVVGS